MDRGGRNSVAEWLVPFISPDQISRRTARSICRWQIYFDTLVFPCQGHKLNSSIDASPLATSFGLPLHRRVRQSPRPRPRGGDERIQVLFLLPPATAAMGCPRWSYVIRPTPAHFSSSVCAEQLTGYDISSRESVEFGKSVYVIYTNDEPTATDADVYVYYHHERSQYEAVVNGRADKGTCTPQAPIQPSDLLRTGTCLEAPAGKTYPISLGSYTDPVSARRLIARSYSKSTSRRRHRRR
jgi:hypothetical protein